MADGNCLFLKSLSPGIYKLRVKGYTNSTVSKIEFQGNQFAGPIGWNQTTTYVLKLK